MGYDYIKTRIAKEFEIYILIIIFGIWYYANSGGAIKGDESIWAWQGYYFYKGNMSAEQYRPMGRYFIGLGQLFLGRTTIGAKILLVVFSLLTIYLTYLTTKVLSKQNRVISFISAGFLGVTPLFGNIAVSVRLGSILTFFVILLFYLTIRLYKTKSLIKRQRLFFIIGIISVCTFATKLYGIFFSIVILVYIIRMEWYNIRKIKLFKIKSIKEHLKKEKLFLPIFIFLGIVFGLYMRWQLSIFLESAGSKGKEGIPDFLNEIILNLNSTIAHAFFITIGVFIFLILWIIVSLIGKESITVIIKIKRRQTFNQKFHILIYSIGAIIGFIIVYLPYIVNPIALFTNSIITQSMVWTDKSPEVINGTQYSSSPWWSYLYWSYIQLGLLLIGIIIFLFVVFILLFITKKIGRNEKLLVLYTLIPFIIFSIMQKKSSIYLVVLYPLFIVFLFISINYLMETYLMKILRNNIKLKNMMIVMIAIIMIGLIIPIMPQDGLGHDSEYDKAGEIVTDFVNTNSNTTIYILTYDRFALTYYMSNEAIGKAEVVPLFSDDYSVDAMGHKYTHYYPQDVLYNMTVNGKFDIFVDELRFNDEFNDIRIYIKSNWKINITIGNEIIIYYRR